MFVEVHLKILQAIFQRMLRVVSLEFVIRNPWALQRLPSVIFKEVTLKIFAGTEDLLKIPAGGLQKNPQTSRDFLKKYVKGIF